MYTLRSYQEEAVQAALLAFGKGKPFIIQAATGAGKSLIIAELCHRIGGNVLILQPSKELLEQNYAKLASYGIRDIGVYSASKNRREIARYTYATIGSIYRVPELFLGFDHIIIDECDLVNPKSLTGMYQKFFAAIGCKDICGLTATPYRIDTGYWTDKNGALNATAYLKMCTRIGRPTFWSGGIVFKVETEELIGMGYLSRIKYFVKDISLGSLRVNSTGADYTEESLEVFWNDQRLQDMADIIRSIDKECNRNLIFCSSVRQATRATQLLNDNGIPATLVTGKTPAKEREEIVSDFRAGKFKHLVNMGVFTVGFDVPELDSIVMARPTMSLRLYYQCLGRGLRLDPGNPGKVLRFYDLAGVVRRLGHVEKIRITKEDDNFRDRVESDAGILTNVPLFTFQIPKQETSE